MVLETSTAVNRGVFNCLYVSFNQLNDLSTKVSLSLNGADLVSISGLNFNASALSTISFGDESTITSSTSVSLRILLSSVFAFSGVQTNKEINTLYKEGKKYYVDSEVFEETSGEVAYYSKYLIDNGYEVSSLFGSVKPTGSMPYEVLSNVESGIPNNSKLFMFDNTLKRHNLACYNELPTIGIKPSPIIKYGLSLKQSGTIAFRFYLDSSSTESNRYLFDIYNSLNSSIVSVRKTSLNGISLYVGNTISTTINSIPLDTWNTLFLSYSSSGIVFRINDSSSSVSSVIDLSSSYMNLGASLSRNNYLDGRIEMLVLKGISISSSLMTTLKPYLIPCSIVKSSDSIGRIKAISFKTPGHENQIVQSYQYSDTSTNLSQLVSKEYLNNGDNYNYTYTNGLITERILKTNGDTPISKTVYTYDSFNRLLTEEELSYSSGTYSRVSKRQYSYDTNGNIRNLYIFGNVGSSPDVNETYTYDSTIKDKLLRITNYGNPVISLTYSSTDPFLITSYGSNTLTYTGRRLKSFGSTSFTYDSNGVRSSKTTNSVTTTYINNGKRVEAIKKGNDILLVVYDELGNAIGLTHDNNEYYLLKDMEGNIIRIVDKSYTTIVSYAYTAYGVPTISDIAGTTESSFIALNNPFLYKGYVYDRETNLYYCLSRFYDPVVARWISIDSASYLDTDSLDGLNLYAYCGNNSVDYKQSPAYSSSSLISSSVFRVSNGKIYSSGNTSSGLVGQSRVNWKKGGFRIPIWISSLLSGSDFGALIAPALRTIYQYIRYPGVKDLNKLYGLDFVPGKLNTVCSAIGYGLLGLNIGLSAWSNFTNDNLTTKQQWISFGVDTAYILGTFGIGYGVGALVALIPYVGVFIAPFVSAGVTLFIEWTNEKWGWLDDVKQWLNNL